MGVWYILQPAKGEHRVKFLTSLVEERIRNARDDGAFENIPGSGKPLRLSDDSGVPEDLRMAYKILKNAGMIPPEMELRKELLNLQDLIDQCQDRQQRDHYRARLALKQLEFDMTLERRAVRLPQRYRGAVQCKLNQY
jgi:hypothetical protein